MGFDREPASKMGHVDILQNPDVIEFQEHHKDVPRPDVKSMADVFGACPRASLFTGKLPQIVVAIDGSRYEASADEREPSRKVGYVKVGMVAMDMQKYDALGSDSIYVDPLAVNRLLTSDALSMALPGAYTKRNQFLSAGEGFRFYVQRYFDSDRTTIGDSTSTLLDTLIALLKYNNDVVQRDAFEYVRVDGCPNPECPTNGRNENGKPLEEKTFFVPVLERHTTCDDCGGQVFIVDSIRVGEAFLESGSNLETYGRVMLLSEHLLAAHWIRHYHQHQMTMLNNIGFVMDGPLSIAGESAKLHRPLMALIWDVNSDLKAQGFDPIFIMGLTKTGMTVDHFSTLTWPAPNDEGAEKFLDFAFPVTDDYRYTYITPRPRRNDKPFGDEFYYGQDILLRTARGHEFVISLPYPARTKKDAGFKHRFDINRYPTAGRAFELIRTLESDLYTNALVPVILAHEYASISLVPGGKVLDIATAQSMSRK